MKKLNLIADAEVEVIKGYTLKDLEDIYDSVIEESKSKYESFGLVEENAEDYTGLLSCVYIDKDDEIFTYVDIDFKSNTAVTPRMFFSKKCVCMLEHSIDVIAYEDNTDGTKEELEQWFKEEYVPEIFNFMSFISFEEFIEQLQAEE